MNQGSDWTTFMWAGSGFVFVLSKMAKRFFHLDSFPQNAIILPFKRSPLELLLVWLTSTFDCVQFHPTVIMERMKKSKSAKRKHATILRDLFRWTIKTRRLQPTFTLCSVPESWRHDSDRPKQKRDWQWWLRKLSSVAPRILGLCDDNIW